MPADDTTKAIAKLTDTVRKGLINVADTTLAVWSCDLPDACERIAWIAFAHTGGVVCAPDEHLNDRVTGAAAYADAMIKQYRRRYPREGDGNDGC